MKHCSTGSKFLRPFSKAFFYLFILATFFGGGGSIKVLKFLSRTVSVAKISIQVRLAPFHRWHQISDETFFRGKRLFPEKKFPRWEPKCKLSSPRFLSSEDKHVWFRTQKFPRFSVTSFFKIVNLVLESYDHFEKLPKMNKAKKKAFCR